MRGRRWGFILLDLERFLNLLPTYPFKGSKFHVVLFQNIFVSLVQFLVFEKWFLKKKVRGRKGLRLGNEWGWLIIYKEVKVGG